MCGNSNHPRTLKNESLQAVQRTRKKRRLLSRATSKVCKDAWAYAAWGRILLIGDLNYNNIYFECILGDEGVSMYTVEVKCAQDALPRLRDMLH